MSIGIIFLALTSLGLVGQDRSNVDQIRSMSLEELMSVKVTSASRQEESLSDTIVPMTVITSDMIRDSKALTLKDLLLEFVPGMTHVQDHNEVNIAMRGVYSSSQQKILFMIDGVRLNSRSYSMAAPDFSIPLVHIERIEVLRGPASSLYGNVALAAAINIILKKGEDENGADLYLGAGSFNQRKFSFVMGNKDHGVDWLIWAQHYQSDGQKIWIKPEDNYSPNPISEDYPAILEGFTDTPSQVVGVKLRTKAGNILFSYQKSHYIEPFSSAGITGEAYDYDAYDKFDGLGPGLLTSGWISEYNKTIALSENLKGFVSLYGGENKIHSCLIVDSASLTYGAPYWREGVYGGLAHVTYDFKRGNLLTGFQADGFAVTASAFPFGSGGHITTDISTPEMPLLYNGTENTWSAFSQLKYHLTDNIIANVGVRYDLKKRKNDQSIKKWSPRIGLVYKGANQFNLKASFSQSFVDAPYWYRFTTLSSYRGAESLDPELLNSIQIMPQWVGMENSVKYGLNFFYNDLDDFIYRDNLAQGSEPIYSNAGILTSWGVEQEFLLRKENWSITSIATYQYADRSEKFGVTDHAIHNVPQFTSSLSLDSYAIAGLQFHLQALYVGKQKSPIDIRANGVQVVDPFPNSGVDFFDPDNEVPGVTLLNGAIEWRLPIDGFSLHFRGSNLADKEYRQGGSTLFPYPQAGRSWLLEVHWKWDFQ